MICTLVGARPQFVKAGPLSRALKAAEIPEVLIHTGQHYDDRMSEVFFQDLDLPRPAVNLDVGSGLHGWQTGEVMRRLEPVLMEHRPEALVVFGDTNSTLAGALTAAKLHIPVVHVEAGLRSFNREMPEEINRVVTDHISTLLLAPTTTAMTLLANEGLSGRSLLSGDITVDALAFAVNRSPGADALEPYGMEAGAYMLATLHRPATVDDPDTLSHVLSALAQLSQPVLLPLHPRTAHAMRRYGIEASGAVRVIEPVGYLEFIALLNHAAKMVTDSGGVQKEAFLLDCPCVTVRPETEWVETVEAGWNRLVDPTAPDLVNEIETFAPPVGKRPDVYGTDVARTMAQAIQNLIS